MLGFNMGTVAGAVSQIAMQNLRGFAARDILRAGLVVERFVAEFRRDFPEQVPSHPAIPGRGLLARDAMPFGDFELAKHLLHSNHRVMVNIQNLFPGMPILMAYLAVVSVGAESSLAVALLPGPLDYVVAESGVRQRLRRSAWRPRG